MQIFLPYELSIDIVQPSSYRRRLYQRILWHVQHYILSDRPFHPEKQSSFSIGLKETCKNPNTVQKNFSVKNLT